ncbi:MAG: hypothetical protein ACYC0X_15165 [Pirellulaceae bacterium]
MDLFKTVRYVVIAMIASTWGIGWDSASAAPQHGGHANHQQPGSAEPQHGSVDDEHAGHDQPAAAPHGGQLTKLKPLSFEVVYQPKEIRVYLYGPFPQPANSKDVKGEISLQQRSGKRVTRLTLQHVAPPEGEQDYLSVPADLSRVKEGELSATIKLENVPLPPQSTATFTQAVVLSKGGLQVVLAELDPSDQDRIARQRVCPVTGAELNSMGGPVKVLVGGKPLYLCCKGCLSKVKSDPEKFLSKAIQSNQSK